MSRLDSFIRRLQAQRACLDWAIAHIKAVDGAVIELGLGNGRTFDHLRAAVNGTRTIYAVDRKLAAHPDCVPAGDRLVLGDFTAALPALKRRLGRTVALVNADTGSGDRAASQTQALSLPALIDPLLVARAVVVSDQDMAPDPALGWRPQKLPRAVEPGRYFLYRKD